MLTNKTVVVVEPTKKRCVTLSNKCPVQVGFDFSPFVGKKVLRGNINSYRVHCWNYFFPEFRLDGKQQEMIDEGLLKPKISVTGDSDMCKKAEFLKRVVKKVVFTTPSRYYLGVFLNTPDSETLGKAVEYLKEFGIKVKWEVAHKDELKGI